MAGSKRGTDSAYWDGWDYECCRCLGIYDGGGATAVAVGTGQFVNPRCCVEIIEGLEEFCRKQGVKKITEVKGVAQV